MGEGARKDHVLAPCPNCAPVLGPILKSNIFSRRDRGDASYITRYIPKMGVRSLMSSLLGCIWKGLLRALILGLFELGRWVIVYI